MSSSNLFCTQLSIATIHTFVSSKQLAYVLSPFSFSRFPEKYMFGEKNSCVVVEKEEGKSIIEMENAKSSCFFF